MSVYSANDIFQQYDSDDKNQGIEILKNALNFLKVLADRSRADEIEWLAQHITHNSNIPESMRD